MTDKELRRMSRAELLQLLIDQMEENERLRTSLADAEAELKNRAVAISEAGTLAEAALRLNRVFEAADAAAAQYLENVRASAPEKEEKPE